MRISRIKVNNFKSLVNFELQLDKFSCLIGLNGAGKTTILQFLDFLSQCAKGNIEEWLNQREWKGTELLSKSSPSQKTLEFTINLVNDDETDHASWNATFNPSKNALRCTKESITIRENELVSVKDGKYSIRDIPLKSNETESKMATHSGFTSYTPGTEHSGTIAFDYQGSIISQLKEGVLPSSIVTFRDFFRDMKSLELLSPQLLRRRSRDLVRSKETTRSMGIGGERLSSFLHELNAEQKSHLLNQLRKAYPRLNDLKIKSLPYGWKELEVEEKISKRKLETTSKHINDGLLRLIAILAELESSDRFVILDEIENGINPELIEFVLNALMHARQQILVTTHSPLILNFLPDDTARSAVLYIYKTQEGSTASIPFFSIPSQAEKLNFMGPGEVFADTNLTELLDEIQSIHDAGH